MLTCTLRALYCQVLDRASSVTSTTTVDEVTRTPVIEASKGSDGIGGNLVAIIVFLVLAVILAAAMLIWNQRRAEQLKAKVGLCLFVYCVLLLLRLNMLGAEHLLCFPGECVMTFGCGSMGGEVNTGIDLPLDLPCSVSSDLEV